MAKKIKRAVFKFKPFSKKQRKILNWWTEDSPVKDAIGIIADGAIRSGKTVSMSLSFVLWAMSTFNEQNLGMAGKTIGSFRRNVLLTLKLMLRARGYKVKEHRADNLLVITSKATEVTNYFYIFGGKDERSQDLIQGITLAGMFFDEVVLMPESFVNQAVGRCSVDGSKLWFNCNPGNPLHYFNQEWILKAKKRNILYLHFTMDDNLSLSQTIKERYYSMFSGVFFNRYILGLWVAAEGVIYRIFAENEDDYLIDNDTLKKKYKDSIFMINIGVDFGGNGSGHAFTATAITKGYKEVIALHSVRYNAKDVAPEDLEKLFIEFVRMILDEYSFITYIYCDNAEQTLISGFKKALKKSDLGYLKVRNALKTDIIDRIRATNRLITQHRFYYTINCKSLKIALSSALWDEKEKTEDVRLDDGSTDIDSLDSFEYTFENQIDKLIKYE